MNREEWKVVKVRELENEVVARGYLRDGEHVTISINFLWNNPYLSMRPEDFFSVGRMREWGVPKGTATRINGGVSISNPESCRDMNTWVSKYNNTRRLLQIKNVGRNSGRWILIVLRQANLPIIDAHGWLEK